MVRKKINTAGRSEAGYQTCEKSNQWWNMRKRFSGIITHYINSSVPRTT